MLLATPFLIGAHSRWWLIYPILVFLACVNAIVQPARQAAIPNLVPSGQVGKANAIVAATSMLAGAVGFGVAGAILALSPTGSTPNMLFVADAMTFVLAAAIVFTIPNLGGGASQASVSGALRRAGWVVRAPPAPLIGNSGWFFFPCS